MVWKLFDSTAIDSYKWKNLTVSKVCKDDSHLLAELKQKKSKRLILLLQHIAITSMCS